MLLALAITGTHISYCKPFVNRNMKAIKPPCRLSWSSKGYRSNGTFSHWFPQPKILEQNVYNIQHSHVLPEATLFNWLLYFVCVCVCVHWFCRLTKCQWYNSLMGCTHSRHFCPTATNISTPAHRTCQQTWARSQVCVSFVSVCLHSNFLEKKSDKNKAFLWVWGGKACRAKHFRGFWFYSFKFSNTDKMCPWNGYCWCFF